jgi:hypothetical protein
MATIWRGLAPVERGYGLAPVNMRGSFVAPANMQRGRNDEAPINMEAGYTVAPVNIQHLHDVVSDLATDSTCQYVANIRC